MLPKDAEKRRNDAAADNQSRLDPHLKERLPKERVIPYNDDLFRDAAIEWLVSTDQVCQNSQSSNTVLMYIPANPSFRTPSIPEHDPHSCPCNEWSQDPRLPPNSSSHHRYF
jgi:hypothetical protein